jgi:hypothetical protein
MDYQLPPEQAPPFGVQVKLSTPLLLVSVKDSVSDGDTAVIE